MQEIQEIKIDAIIIAAGSGTRMRSSLPKVLHEVAAQPILEYVLQTAKNTSLKSIVVASKQLAQNENFEKLRSKYQFHVAMQQKPLGTADAVRSALDYLEAEYALVLYGDVPFLKAETIDLMRQAASNTGAELVLLGVEYQKNNNYGKIFCDRNGVPCRIVEQLEATEHEKSITLCNAGSLLVKTRLLKEFFEKTDYNSSFKEQYLTDLVQFVYEHKNQYNVGLIKISSHDEVIGVNDRSQLAEAESIIQNELRAHFLKAGVTMIDPQSVYFSKTVQIANDVIIHPYVFIGKEVTLDSNVTILSFTHIEGASIASNAVIGPFARIRPNTKIASHSKIGNFVEIKNANIAEHSKISHLSYVGDATIGSHVNIGAGTVFCNYDGKTKHHSIVHNNSFIGSNTSIISPIEIGEGALTGAGSVITQDVPAKTIAIARAKQKNTRRKT